MFLYFLSWSAGIPGQCCQVGGFPAKVGYFSRVSFPCGGMFEAFATRVFFKNMYDFKGI